MTRTGVVVSAAIVLWPGFEPPARPDRDVGLSISAPSAGAPQGQTFRTTTDVVTVDVSVRVDGRSVPGLTAADFELLDNGVRQRIDVAQTAAVPVDLTIVADLSGNRFRPWNVRVDMPAVAAAVESDVREIATLLRPDDRVRVLGVDTYAHQIAPLQTANRLPAIRTVAAGGMAALHDAIVAALVQPVEPGRRHIVVAQTKGTDTISAVDAAGVRDVAARSDALLHIVAMGTEFVTEAKLRGFQCQNMGYCQPTRRFWQPFTRTSLQPDGLRLTPGGELLADAARVTGGALHVTQLINEPTMAGTFRRAFDDFRSSYVLQYTPRGVAREGWHAITVSVPRLPASEISARRGYAVEAARGGAAAAAPAPDSRAAPLETLIAAYDKGDYAAAEAGLTKIADARAMIRDFTERGNPWPANPRREGVFVLELAETALFSRRKDDRDAAAELLTRFHPLIRHPLEPDAFERHWLWAEIAIAQGLIHSAFAEPLVAHALSRFPGEPRFVLARAIVTDQAWPLGRTASDSRYSTSLRPSAAHVKNVTERYAAAMAFSETAAEARVRLAWFLHRLGQHADALVHLDAIRGDTGLDPVMQYVQRLVRGQVLEAAGQPDASLQAYRQALALAPHAQSARIALMNGLLRAGDRRGAAQLAEQIQTEREGTDPWWSYVQGDFRLYPLALARLREMAK
jgi:VWFA-related protein